MKVSFRTNLGASMLISILIIVFLSMVTWLISEKSDYFISKIKEQGVLVLVYHRVLPGDGLEQRLQDGDSSEIRFFSVSSVEFENQIRFLKENNANFITPKQFEDFMEYRYKLPPRSVLITFDDADESIYKYAFPILKREKVPILYFVIAGCVGYKDFEGLKISTWNQINEMVDSGLVTVGSHTHGFHYLDGNNIPAFMDFRRREDFKEDILLSIKTIEKETGVKTRYFAYPYGFGTPDTDKIVLDTGLKFIFTLEPGVVRAGDSTLSIKRNLVNQDTWPLIAKWVKR